MRPRLTFLLTAGLALALLTGRSPAVAQEVAPQIAPPSTADTDPKDNLPLVLLVLQRPADSAARRDDPNIELLATLSKTLRDSGKFRAVLYRPALPSVRRALLEHTLDTAELIEPMKTDALQHLGRTLGAHFVLSLIATADKDGLVVETLFQESLSPREWRTLFKDRLNIPAMAGKRHLKRDEMVRLTVDNLTARMGAPSKLISDLNLETIARTQAALEEKDKRKGRDKSKPTAPKIAQNDTPPDNPDLTTDVDNPPQKEKVDTPPANPVPAKGAPSGKTNAGAQSKGGKPNKPNGNKTGAKANPKDARNPDKDKSGENATPPNIESDAGNENLQPSRAASPNSPKEDNEALATRFRQQGDLANVITSLRRAINERPRELGLRRQLIQAYQDRHLLVAALTETNRALVIAPEDAGLHRLYGDALLAKGDATGALKAYQEACRLNPNDIASQVALGDALLADNRYTEGMNAYAFAMKGDPKSPLPHRRMARALANSAASDPARYVESLEHVRQARALIPMTDTETYLEDYVGLMRLMETRLRDALDELQNTYQAFRLGKRSGDELIRAIVDMRRRAEAAADYLDKLPPAAGMDVTHAHYQQASAFLLQSLSLFREYITKGETHTEEALSTARANTRRELSAAGKRLNANRAATTKPSESSSDTSKP